MEVLTSGFLYAPQSRYEFCGLMLALAPDQLTDEFFSRTVPQAAGCEWIARDHPRLNENQTWQERVTPFPVVGLFDWRNFVLEYLALRVGFL
jgi:hypothetical protein